MPKKNKPSTLVIVESPSKAKTIHKYLGDDYVISSSVGHIIDLPKSRLAVDVDNDFKPEYITIRGKAKVLNELKKRASDASRVLLATDPDREGEAISWHLARALSPKNDNIMRIEFNEITESAVKEAISHPRDIDMDLVKAQQARRILDRIVGYYISPILWKKIKKGLSAGRVQSVALKVICDREEEINRFIPEEYWTLDVDARHGGKKFTASLVSFQGNKYKIQSSSEMDSVLEYLKGKKLVVEDVKKQERRRRPSPPYITSKLQQDAANRLGFTSQKTMIIAQQLYEGIDVKGEGPEGLITYMRTDSTRISQGALTSVRSYINDAFDSRYLPESANVYSNKKNAQDAHEAIRPTDVFRSPESIKNDLTRDQYRLYELIWKRFVASQMTPEISEVVTVNLKAGDYGFRVSGSTVLFNGFTAIDKYSKTEKMALPVFSPGDGADVIDFRSEQHFTTPPPRFNDASLVKFLEESGIGRPSTYAPTLATLIKRYYVNRHGRQIVPTVLGKLVNEIMSKHFSSLVSIDFTANMEDRLDHVEDAKTDWIMMLHDFYGPFKSSIDDAEQNIEEMKGVLDEQTDIECEHCGRKMVKKLGKFGFFLACSGFPDCRNAKSLPLGKCPKCEKGDVVKRSSKTGRGGTFYACTDYPECDFFTREVPADRSCPKCGRLLFTRKIKGRGEKVVCLNTSCNFELELLDENGQGEQGQQ
ncbi:MAG TPA: type I DNA topoisomerase [Spirochaetota bacterium]|nr:type I DNA topoisomerase [Spirochaetota bacterium]HPI91223.1 type I DNA topoisomerase [Spirochaetota bacterium]HPR50042.1 type I DNA topoisomerase [Spirochaetota bacterium]